jgi:small subunit ribosomal protein S8
MAINNIQKTSKKKKGLISYPLGDFLVRIKNIALAKRRTVEADRTKLIVTVADTLKRAGYLSEVEDKDNKIIVRLTYQRKAPRLVDLKLISKPGLRRYMTVQELENYKSPSVYIVSTPKGVMTSREAVRERAGGEVLAEIW